jgi:hypothetical protein
MELAYSPQSCGCKKSCLKIEKLEIHVPLVTGAQKCGPLIIEWI